MENHLSASSNIIMSKDFEKGVVKYIDGRSLYLTSSEKQALKSFEKENIAVYTPYMPSNFAVDVLKCKNQKLEHGPMEWTPVTTNVCGRLFSRAKLNLDDLKHRLTPMHLESELFYT